MKISATKFKSWSTRPVPPGLIIPSFLCLCCFLGIFVPQDFCPGRHWVRTGYELRTHRTLGKLSIITCNHLLTLSEMEYPYVSVCVDFFKTAILLTLGFVMVLKSFVIIILMTKWMLKNNVMMN